MDAAGPDVAQAARQRNDPKPVRSLIEPGAESPFFLANRISFYAEPFGLVIPLEGSFGYRVAFLAPIIVERMRDRANRKEICRTGIIRGLSNLL